MKLLMSYISKYVRFEEEGSDIYIKIMCSPSGEGVRTIILKNNQHTVKPNFNKIF